MLHSQGLPSSFDRLRMREERARLSPPPSFLCLSPLLGRRLLAIAERRESILRSIHGRTHAKRVTPVAMQTGVHCAHLQALAMMLGKIGIQVLPVNSSSLARELMMQTNDPTHKFGPNKTKGSMDPGLHGNRGDACVYRWA